MRPTARSCALAAAWCAAAFAILGAVALGTSAGRSLDLAALRGLGTLDDGRVAAVARELVHLVDPLPYLVLSAGVVAIAVARERRDLAAGAAAVLAGTAVSSQVLKPLLATDRSADGVRVLAEAYPSGHATAALALALALVLVLPGRLRPAAAVVGASLAAGLGVALVLLGWHFASDVAGGFLLASGWTLAVAAVLAAVRATRAAGAAVDGPASRGAAATAAATIAVGALAAALVARHADALAAFSAEHTRAAAVALGLAGLAAALALAVTATVRRT